MKVKFSEVQTGTAVVSTIPAGAKQVNQQFPADQLRPGFIEAPPAPPVAPPAPPVAPPAPPAPLPAPAVPPHPPMPPMPPQAPPKPAEEAPPGSKCFSCGQEFKIDIYNGDFCPVCGVNLNDPGAFTRAELNKKSAARARAAGGKNKQTISPEIVAPQPNAPDNSTQPLAAAFPPVLAAAGVQPGQLAPPVPAAAIHEPGPSVVVLPSARPANSTTAIAVIPSAAKSGVSLYDPSTWIDENAVPISMEDVFMPRINIVQKVGELSNVHIHGSIVLNQTLAVYVPEQRLPDGRGSFIVTPGTPPLRVVVTCFRPMQYVEKVLNADHRGDMFNTPDEVLAAGGTLDYAEAQADPNKILFQKMATALVIIQKPADVTDLESFPYEWAGGRWAPALWSMKGTAFTHAYKIMATNKQHGPLRGRKWYERAWLLSTQIKKFNQNFAFVPVIKLDVETGPDFLTLINTILSRPRVASTEQEGA